MTLCLFHQNLVEPLYFVFQVLIVSKTGKGALHHLMVKIQFMGLVLSTSDVLS